MGICKKNQEKSIFVQFLGGVSKKNFSIFQVLGTVYFAVCHIYIRVLAGWVRTLNGVVKMTFDKKKCDL